MILYGKIREICRKSVKNKPENVTIRVYDQKKYD